MTLLAQWHYYDTFDTIENLLANINIFILQVIEAIANALSSVDGCSLLDVDPGLSTNRTVYTFVGSPEAVIEGALNGARAALHLIDMRRHHGNYSFNLN